MGLLLTQSRAQFLNHWWEVFFPGLFIIFTVISFNIIGDELRILTNPKEGSRLGKHVIKCFQSHGQVKGEWNYCTILNDVNITVNKGEVVGLVGKTGSGKSMLGWAVIDLLPRLCYVSSGSILYDKIPITEISNFRGRKTTMVFQDPMQSLNPLQTIGTQVGILSNNLYSDKSDRLQHKSINGFQGSC